MLIEKFELLEKAIIAGGTRIKELMQDPQALKFNLKSDGSPVTTFDLESEDQILKLLGDDLPVIAEESDGGHSLLEENSDYFLVDPLDGTRNCKRYFKYSVQDIGYGPLGGLVLDGKLQACAYYNIPTNCLYSALRGQGAYTFQLNMMGVLPKLEDRERLLIAKDYALKDSAILFFVKHQADVALIQSFVREEIVDTAYRFGGFANDATRLARNLEQVQLQSGLKAWDYAASLIAKEAGYQVICDPFGKQLDSDAWPIELNCSVLIARSEHLEPFLKACRQLG